VQQRVGKPRVIVVQGGQVGVASCGGGLCIGVGVGWGGGIRSDQMDGEAWSHGLSMCSRREER
jgi:hypothetical protein